MTFRKHWADTRAGVFIELPEGATVQPMTDQPSAREELAQVLEDAARALRG